MSQSNANKPRVIINATRHNMLPDMVAYLKGHYGEDVEILRTRSTYFKNPSHMIEEVIEAGKGCDVVAVIITHNAHFVPALLEALGDEMDVIRPAMRAEGDHKNGRRNYVWQGFFLVIKKWVYEADRLDSAYSERAKE